MRSISNKVDHPRKTNMFRYTCLTMRLANQFFYQENNLVYFQSSAISFYLMDKMYFIKLNQNRTTD